MVGLRALPEFGRFSSGDSHGGSMIKRLQTFFILFALMLPASTLSARAIAMPQASGTAATTQDQPVARRLVNFGGTLRDQAGQPVTGGVVGVRFAIYGVQQGGTPLWTETQNIQPDGYGNYVTLLGSTSSDGLPLDLFSSGDSRWLEVQVQLPGVEAQPRILIVSVPYALKAVDADTLGGRPSSAFVLAQPSVKADASSLSNVADVSGKGPNTTTNAISGTTQNQITKWVDSSGTLGDSAVTETGGNVGIGTTTPQAQLHVQSAPGVSSYMRIGAPADQQAAISFADDTNGQDAVLYRPQGTRDFRLWTPTAGDIFSFTQDGRVGMGTANPQAKFHLEATQSSYFMIRSPISQQSAISFADTTNGHDFIMYRVQGTRDFSMWTPSAGDFVRITQNGRMGLYNAAPNFTLDVNGQINAAGGLCINGTCKASGPIGSLTSLTAGAGLTGGGASGDVALSLNAAALTRAITYLAGCDTCSVLQDTDDQKTIYQNVLPSPAHLVINSVTCYADAGTLNVNAPTINLQRDDGSPANVLASDLQCLPGGGNSSSSFSGTENIMNPNDKLDFVMTTAGGVAKRVTVVITATVN
jgi:hypothetical protein